MYCTLSQLRDSINQKIVEQGEAAPVAAFIYTSNEVVTEVVTEDNLVVTQRLDMLHPDGVVQEVLFGIGDSDYIYEMIWDKIQIEIAEVIEDTQSHAFNK